MGLSFEKVETGRTHSTRDGIVPIVDADGNTECEYQLLATVDGAKVKLLSKSAGWVETQVQAYKNAQTDDGEPEGGAWVEE